MEARQSGMGLNESESLYESVVRQKVRNSLIRIIEHERKLTCWGSVVVLQEGCQDSGTQPATLFTQLWCAERGNPLFIAREGVGGVKKRMLPTRKGSRNHKAVDRGSNFASRENGLT